MSAEKAKTPRELLHDARGIVVKPHVVEALRRKCAALKAEREEERGKRDRAGKSQPIYPAALILSGLLVYEANYGKEVISIRNSKWLSNGLTQNDIDRGDALLAQCGFAEKERAGFKGGKHYRVFHEAIARQIPDLLGTPLDGGEQEEAVSDTASETESPTGVENGAPVSGTASETELRPMRLKQNSDTVSETDPICTSYIPEAKTIDRRARSRESNRSSRATGQRSIDGGKNSIQKKGNEGSKATLDDYEESIRRIPEADIADADRRFGSEWSSKLGDLDEGDLARLACSVGDADRGRMGIAAKKCAEKLATDGVDLPWRYMLRSAHTLVEKRARRTEPKRTPAGTDGNVASANSSPANAQASTHAELASKERPGLHEELAALASAIGADERLSDADAAREPGQDGSKLVVARNARHAGQLRQHYGGRLEEAGWKVITRGELPSMGKADNGEASEAGEVA